MASNAASTFPSFRNSSWVVNKKKNLWGERLQLNSLVDFVFCVWVYGKPSLLAFLPSYMWNNLFYRIQNKKLPKHKHVCVKKLSARELLTMEIWVKVWVFIPQVPPFPHLPEPKLQSPDATRLIPAECWWTQPIPMVLTALVLILQAYLRSWLFPVPWSLTRRIWGSHLTIPCPPPSSWWSLSWWPTVQTSLVQVKCVRPAEQLQ